MDRKQKLIARLLQMPRDFTADEMQTLLEWKGFEIDNAGKTSGSAIRFIDKDGNIIRYHKPHPSNVLKRYVLEKVIQVLREGGYIQ